MTSNVHLEEENIEYLPFFGFGDPSAKVVTNDEWTSSSFEPTRRQLQHSGHLMTLMLIESRQVSVACLG